MNSFDNVFKNKNVLITGHTGFKGSWLSIWLNELGANVIGYALEPLTKEDNFVLTGIEKKITHIIGDIRDRGNLQNVFDKYRPEFVFHLAAQAIVRESYKNPVETYETNIMGTVNVLEAVRKAAYVRAAVIVTSDKCYDNKEWIWGYRENDPMGGYDPYSSSKGCVELVVASYRNSFFGEDNKIKTAIVSARAGNVIGGGDWANDRIFPDCIKALRKGDAIEIRNPGSVRPWQHVLESLSGYLKVCVEAYKEPKRYSGAWNFGPLHTSVLTVSDLVEKIIRYWGSGESRVAPNASNPHEARYLTLDISKAVKQLNWKPILNADNAIKMAVDWYQNYEKANVYDICVNQIREYSRKREDQGREEI